MAIAALSTSCLSTANKGRAEIIFKEKCSMCHPNGGNIMKGTKGLKRDDLLRNNIRNSQDIIVYLRNPGPGMPRFDANSIPDKEAAILADYILKTFR